METKDATENTGGESPGLKALRLADRLGYLRGRLDERQAIYRYAANESDRKVSAHDVIWGAHLKVEYPLIEAENRVTHDTQSAAKPFVDDVPDPGVSDDGQEAAREADMANEAHITVPGARGHDD
jgi:hypothetical protein